VPNKITLITAERNGGKTTTLMAYLEKRFLEPSELCGVLSLANPEKTCYRLKDLTSKEERVVMDINPLPDARTYKRFFVDDSVFAWMNYQIMQNLSQAKLVVFDEIGRFELDGDGLDASFRRALQIPSVEVVATVRKPFLESVIKEYALDMFPLEIIECGYGKEKES